MTFGKRDMACVAGGQVGRAELARHLIHLFTFPSRTGYFAGRGLLDFCLVLDWIGWGGNPRIVTARTLNVDYADDDYSAPTVIGTNKGNGCRRAESWLLLSLLVTRRLHRAG